MKYAIVVFVLVCICVSQATSQDREQKPAVELQQLETSWLTADLNHDAAWLRRFSSQKLDEDRRAHRAIEDRSDAVKKLVGTALQPKEMKVRISGTISLLTNDPDQNRSYFFLDTFNKIGGKWRVIASNISPTADVSTNSPNQIDPQLRALENEWAKASVSNDTSVLGKILSPDLVITANDGRLRNREDWMKEGHAEDIQSFAKSELQIRVINDSVAVVTGVDTTVRLDKDGKEIVHTDRFTHTWSEDSKGQWQCVASHATRLR